jgi:hypothetical protein
MSHGYHDGMSGYDARQLLVDGCKECEQRAQDVAEALGYLDNGRFVHAWRRAWLWLGVDSAHPRREDLGPLSKAEMPMLRALYAVQVQLERLGVPMGVLPIRSNADLLRDPP